jgi:hypothetical protein
LRLSLKGIEMDMELKVTVEGATDEELLRGELAAMAVFEAAGVNPWEAASAELNREVGLGIDGGEMTEKSGRAAEAWGDAFRAAIEACCAGWTRPPNNPNMKLIY